MFRLSKGAEYAIRGLVYMAMREDGKVSYIEDIAKSTDVPQPYLAKLFQTLAKKGFVRSYRGPGGGFLLARPTSEITLLEIIETMEGRIFLNDCLIHKGFCHRDEICPVHEIWKEAEARFLDVLKHSTLDKLAGAGRIKEKKAGLARPSAKIKEQRIARRSDK